MSRHSFLPAALAAAVGAVGSARADRGFPAASYVIVAKHSGLMLDVEGARGHLAAVQTAGRVAQPNRQFRILHRVREGGHDWYNVQAVHSGCFLDVKDAGKELARLQMGSPGGESQDNRLFRFERDGDAWVIYAKHSGLSLDVVKGGGVLAKLQTAGKGGQDNRRFRIIPASDAASLLAPPPGTAPTLLVMFGGACDQSCYQFVQNLAASLKYPNTVVRYFPHDGEDHARVAIGEHLAKHPQAGLIIVGHSWGGDSALLLANRLGDDGIGISVQLLVTLDAVSRLNFRQNFGFSKTHNLRRWVHVYNSGDSFGDAVAQLGGPWGRQSVADINIYLPKGYAHGDADRMFQLQQVQRELQPLLGQPVDRPSGELEAAAKQAAVTRLYLERLQRPMEGRRNF